MDIHKQGNGPSLRSTVIRPLDSFDEFADVVVVKSRKCAPVKIKGLDGLIQVKQKLTVDIGVVVVSSAYARGNENNLHQPDGTYYLGGGKSPGYGLTNAGARYNLNRRLELFVQASNLLNRKYYSGAQLGPAGFTPQGTYQARPFPVVAGAYPLQRSTFLAPGAPRAAWAGVKVRF